MPWHDDRDPFLDPEVAKLANLFRAARAGLRIPRTLWVQADQLPAPVDPGSFRELADRGLTLPCIIRSGSPTEDTRETSNAGQFLSLPVHDEAAFASALADVIAALPKRDGRPLGVVFVQPLIQANLAGVTFFDGFYFEETTAKGSNQTLTSGQERGHVRRGHVQRGDAHTDWLLRIHRVFGGSLDIEWVGGEPGQEPWLLQVRPALFPIRRCETLSLANHKEILGDPPSPWMVSVLSDTSGLVMDYFSSVEPAVATWDEPYAIVLAERAWMNFSPFFRLMDHWGLPRTMVTEGVGGAVTGPLDRKLIPGRFLRKLPTMIRMALVNFWTMATARRGLRAIQAELDHARTLPELQRANVRALAFSIRTNFAIIMVLSVAARLRRSLGVGEQAAQVVTHRMMARFAAVASRPQLEDRLKGLDGWLAKYGHRGPLESDPWQPRFIELKETLRANLSKGPAPALPVRPQPSILRAALSRPLFFADEFREWFRDRLMRWWQQLRRKMLAEARKAVEAGFLDDPNDVFFLASDDLAAPESSWRDRVTERRRNWQEAKAMQLPTTAPRDVIEQTMARPRVEALADSPGRFLGIGLGIKSVCGTAVRAEELTDLLNGRVLPDQPILIASALEPSWAVIFPRFVAVVAELGGELSHAAILLREAGIPAVMNAEGAFRTIADGDQVCVDPVRGEVTIQSPAVKS